jgi:drug/metabolite transporter (DMT)-like permease
MFIKVAGEEVQPFALVEIRLALGALVMLGVAAFRKGTFAEIRALWKPLTVMGLINCVIPYTLLTWGEQHINSGLAAIYNATTPLWAAAILMVIPSQERPTGSKFVGLLMGMTGVILVVSSSLGMPSESGLLNWLGQGACLLMALSYAIAGIYARKKLGNVAVQVSATGQLVAGALMLLPLAAFQIPSQVPSWQATGSLLTLAIVGTALATMMYYWLIKRVGATGAMLVTYLLPPFALFWGALLLGESFTLLAVGGMALVFAGIAVTSGSGMALVRRWVRREA